MNRATKKDGGAGEGRRKEIGKDTEDGKIACESTRSSATTNSCVSASPARPPARRLPHVHDVKPRIAIARRSRDPQDHA